MCCIEDNDFTSVEYLTAGIAGAPKYKQGRHFNFFLGGGGAIFIFYFSMPPDHGKIGKNSTLYVVIWRY